MKRKELKFWETKTKISKPPRNEKKQITKKPSFQWIYNWNYERKRNIIEMETHKINTKMNRNITETKYHGNENNTKLKETKDFRNEKI